MNSSSTDSSPQFASSAPSSSSSSSVSTALSSATQLTMTMDIDPDRSSGNLPVAAAEVLVNGTLSIVNGETADCSTEMLDDSDEIFDETDLTEFAEQLEREDANNNNPSNRSDSKSSSTTTLTANGHSNVPPKGAILSPNVISTKEYFAYADSDDSDLDSSVCTEIEAPTGDDSSRLNGTSLPVISSSPLDESSTLCDDFSTLKRPAKEAMVKSTPLTMSTFSVATYSAPPPVTSESTHTTSPSLLNHSYSASPNTAAFVNGISERTNPHHLGESEEIFSMDEDLTLKGDSGRGVSYQQHQRSKHGSQFTPSTVPSTGSGPSYMNNPFYSADNNVNNADQLMPSSAVTTTSSSSSRLMDFAASKSKLSTDAALTMLIDSLPSSSATPMTPPSGGESASLTGTMDANLAMEVPYAIMTNKENSCPFFDRRIALMVPVKVGRAIARVRPAPDNAIFDCKVLSRNHALLWYQDGKFYLRDTCSSNGTFINNTRLSSANEKSSPNEIFSGDSVQFGVEVTEKKQVHSCVIATIRLFLPDGTEAKPTSIASDYNLLDEFNNQKGGGSMYGANAYLSSSINFTPSQLIELSHFIKDALHKQALLESQLESMKAVMTSAMDSAKSGWTKVVEEDQLLSRIESLQAKLEILMIAKASDSNDAIPEEAVVETLKQELLHLISDKEKFELSSKASLAKALEEKMVALTNLHSTEMELQAKEEECHKLAGQVEQNYLEMKSLVFNCDKARKDVEELVGKLRTIEEEQLKLVSRFDRERTELQNKVANLEAFTAATGTADSRPLDSTTIPSSGTRDCTVQTETTSESSASRAVQEQLNCTLQGVHLPGQDLSSQPNRTALDTTHSSQNLGSDKKWGTEMNWGSTESDSINLHKDSLIRKYESELLNAKKSLLATKSQCEAFYNSTMSCLVSVDSLLAEKDAAVASLTERVQSFAVVLSGLRTRQRDSLDQMNMLLESEQEDNIRLAKEVRTLETQIDLQNEELEKFQCDIDVLRNGQVTEREEKVKAKLMRVDSAIQTDTDSTPQTTTVDSPDSPQNDKLTTESEAKASGSTAPNTPPILRLSLKEQLDEVIRAIDRVVETNTEPDSAQVPTANTENDRDLSETVLAQFNKVVTINERLKEENEHLAGELAKVKDSFSLLSYQNELSFAMAVCPLLVIVIAIIFAFYPILSYIMGTSGI